MNSREGGGGELEEVAYSSSSRSVSRGRSSSSARSRRGEAALDVAQEGEFGEEEVGNSSARSPSATRRGSYSGKKGKTPSSNPYADWTQNAED